MSRLILFASYIFFINQGFCGLTLDHFPSHILDNIAGYLPIKERLSFYTLNKTMVSYVKSSKDNKIAIGTPYQFTPNLIKDQKIPDSYIKTIDNIFQSSYKYRIPLDITINLTQGPFLACPRGVVKQNSKLKKNGIKNFLLNKILLKNTSVNSNPRNELILNFLDSKRLKDTINSGLDFLECIEIKNKKIPYIESISFTYINEGVENFDKGPSSVENYQNYLNQKFPYLKKFFFTIPFPKEIFEELFSISLENILPILKNYFKISTLTHKSLCVDCENPTYIEIMESLLPAIPSPRLTDLYIGNKFWKKIKESPFAVDSYMNIFKNSASLKTVTYQIPNFDSFYVASIHPHIKNINPSLKMEVTALLNSTLITLTQF